VVSSLASECDTRENPLVFEKNDESKKLTNFMNKRQGRKISRMLINKYIKTSNVSYPFQIEDGEWVKNQEVPFP
jgi:hypothetical protein